MIKIDENLLKELGLDEMSKEDKNKMLRHIYETLEMRVGMRLAGQMDQGQLKEFEQFINQNDEKGALNWLETNFPDYKKTVQEELDKLKEEIKQDSDKILQSE